jgi:hypothetical protein
LIWGLGAQDFKKPFTKNRGAFNLDPFIRKKPVSKEHKKRNAGGGKEEKPNSPEPLPRVVSRALPGLFPGPLPGVFSRAPTWGVFAVQGPCLGRCLDLHSWGSVQDTYLGWCPGPFCVGGGVQACTFLNWCPGPLLFMGGVKSPYMGLRHLHWVVSRVPFWVGIPAL